MIKDLDNFSLEWEAIHPVPIPTIIAGIEHFGPVRSFVSGTDRKGLLTYTDGTAAEAIAWSAAHEPGKCPNVNIPDGWASSSYLMNGGDYSRGTVHCEGNTAGPWPVRATAMLRFLLDEGVRFRLAVLRSLPGANSSGDWNPPLIGSHRAAILTEKQIAVCYDDVQQFIDGFDGHYEKNGQILLWRGLEEIYATDDWARRVYEQHRTLGRIMKRGMVRYWTAMPKSLRIQDLFYREGTPALQFVGYLPATQTMIYSAHLSPNQHPLMREYRLLYQMAIKKQDPQGRPVKDVQVHFFTEEMALREKRTLLDMGIRVFFEDPTGPEGVREVTEEVGPKPDGSLIFDAWCPTWDPSLLEP